MSALITRFLAAPLDTDVARVVAKLAALPGAARVVVMPDVHLAEATCVGVVLAMRDAAVPAAAGADLGCGIDTVRLDGARGDALDDAETAARILAGLERAVPALGHIAPPHGDAADAPSPDALSHPKLAHLARKESARTHGTLGRGNHFVELQEDETGALWLAVHSGSRAIGPAVAAHHGGDARALTVLDGDARDAFLADVAWAVAWAASNRRAILRAALGVLHDVLGAEEEGATHLSRAHDLARRETHFGEPLVVHRKGAMWLPPGETGILPGSMGTSTFHVTARDLPDALASCAHGAGRALSRTAARHRISVRALARSMEGVWFDHRRARDLVEEAPSAYKDVRKVARALADVVRIDRTLRPRLAYKAA